MKTVSTLIVGLAFASSAALARGGSDDNSRFPRGSAAWFQHESLEHSMRLLGVGATVTGSTVTLVDADTSTVSLTLASGEVATFSCAIVDDWSHGGTVLKKDVRCARN